MPSCYPAGGPEFDMEGVCQEMLNCPDVIFPRLAEGVIKEKMKDYEDQEQKEGDQNDMVVATSFRRYVLSEYSAYLYIVL